MSNGGDRYMEANRRSWDARTPTHFGSRFYDVDGFRAGASSLQSIEIEEVGDVDGKSLLHLQCHFGLDTMSWARLGARATGADFSEEAVSLARSLSEELGIDAKFVTSNVYDLPDVLDQRFDVVFTSYGALTWLPDLERWAAVIAHFLEPGGFLYIVDGHPFGSVFYDEEDAVDLRPFYPYSTRGAGPIAFEPGTTYTDGPDEEYGPTFEWGHSVGNILNALISAGLTVEFFHEFHFSAYQALPMMERGDDGWWRLPKGGELVPFLFSLKATKPG